MKNARPLLLSRPAVFAGLALSFLLVVGTSLLSAFSTQGVARANARISHVQTTVLQINQLLATLIDAETGQRGYILTGRDAYLEPYEQARARQAGQLEALRTNLAGSPDQLAILDRIEALIAQKNAEIARTIELRSQRIVGAALNIVESNEGLVAMNSLRELLHALEQNELQELSIRSASAAIRARRFQIISLGMIAIAVLMGGLGVFLLLRRVKELESIITVCAWTKRVKFNGTWVSFEQYLHNRFNLQFTHAISEEAARQLQQEEIDLDTAKTRARPTAPRAK